MKDFKGEERKDGERVTEYKWHENNRGIICGKQEDKPELTEN